MFGREVILPPMTLRPSNDSTFARRLLRGFNVTCWFKNGAEVVIPTVALNSSQAIQHLEEQFPGQVRGYTVRTLA